MASDYYYEYDDEGNLIPIKYERGDILSGKRSTLPNGRYSTIDGKLTRIGEARGPAHYSMSDDLGTKGVLNPIDGKRYDSRAEYYRAVKASGHVIMGDDAPIQNKRETRGDFDCRKELKDAVQKVFSNQPTRKRKGKKK